MRPSRSFDNRTFHIARRERREELSNSAARWVLIAGVVTAALVLLLSGCGNHTKVQTHEVTREELNVIAGPQFLGWAKWYDMGYVVYCDVYIMPREEYPTEACYDAAVRHELRHCYEFEYHGYPGGEIPECPAPEAINPIL